jgi:hypothetical protein
MIVGTHIAVSADIAYNLIDDAGERSVFSG